MTSRLNDQSVDQGRESPESLFLIEMFPSIPIATIHTILARTHNQLDRAVQECLKLETDGEQRTTGSTSSSLHLTPSSSTNNNQPVSDMEIDHDGVATQPAKAEAMISLTPVATGEAATKNDMEDDEDQDQLTQLVEDETEHEPTFEESKEQQYQEESKEDSKAQMEEEDVQIIEQTTSSPLHSAIQSLKNLLIGSSDSPSGANLTSSLVALRSLHHAISNVLQHPEIEKYRLLPYTHHKFRAKICDAFSTPASQQEMLKRSKAVLLQAGWNEISTGGADEGFLLLTDEGRKVEQLQLTIQLLDDLIWEIELRSNSIPSSTSNAVAAANGNFIPADPATAAPPVVPSKQFPAAIDSLLYTPLAKLKQQYKKQKISHPTVAPTPKLSREQMAERIAARLSAHKPDPSSTPKAAAATPILHLSPKMPDAPPANNTSPTSVSSPSSTPLRAGRQTDFNQLAALRQRIAAVRRSKHSKWTTATAGRKRVFTVDDLEKMQEEDLKTRAQFGGGDSSSAAAGGGGKKFRTLADFEVGNPADCLAMGKEMLVLTNKFRAEQGKPPLKWHQALHDIGLVHSKNMALKKVAFGHDGAKQRFAAYPFPTRSAAENVAYSQGVPNVPHCHVDGWIHSPGHRKNMLAHHNWCAIAVYKNPQGAYYSTQLFGLG